MTTLVSAGRVEQNSTATRGVSPPQTLRWTRRPSASPTFRRRPIRHLSQNQSQRRSRSRSRRLLHRQRHPIRYSNERQHQPKPPKRRKRRRPHQTRKHPRAKALRALRNPPPPPRAPYNTSPSGLTAPSMSETLPYLALPALPNKTKPSLQAPPLPKRLATSPRSMVLRHGVIPLFSVGQSRSSEIRSHAAPAT